MLNKIFLILAVALLDVSSCMAQKVFLEGTIIYKVTITNPLKPDMPAQTGQLELTIKGNQLRKELKMGNGYHNVMLINTNNSSIYSLKSVQGNKVAIQLDFDNYKKRADSCKGFVLLPEPATADIAGYKAKKGLVKYRNGNTSIVFYTDEWKLNEPYPFDRYPTPDFIPLSFQYSNDGSLLSFEAQKIQEGPVASSLFRVPADYKLLSSDEYKQLNK